MCHDPSSISLTYSRLLLSVPSVADEAWRTSFTLARQTQGRLMDLCLSLSSHAQRDPVTCEYTAEAAAVLDDVTRLARATHVLHWMSRDIALRLLHSDNGLDALARSGLLTEREASLIKNSSGPIYPRWQMPLCWLMTRVASAHEQGHVTGGDAFHLFFLENVGKLRGTMGSMQDETTDRMPLAYLHLVEVLVDALLVLAPLALYPETGDLSVPLVLLLVFFYSGVLQLSKCAFLAAAAGPAHGAPASALPRAGAVAIPHACHLPEHELRTSPPYLTAPAPRAAGRSSIRLETRARVHKISTQRCSLPR